QLGVPLGEVPATRIAPKRAGANGGVAGGVGAGVLAKVKVGVILAVFGVMVSGGGLLRGGMGSGQGVGPAVESVEAIASGAVSLSTMSSAVPSTPSMIAVDTASADAAPSPSSRVPTAPSRRSDGSPQTGAARSPPKARAAPDDTMTDELSL